MSTKTQALTAQSTGAATEAAPRQNPSQLLQAIVNLVRRDSQVEPQAYLEETKVPHGGE